MRTATIVGTGPISSLLGSVTQRRPPGRVGPVSQALISTAAIPPPTHSHIPTTPLPRLSRFDNLHTSRLHDEREAVHPISRSKRNCTPGEPTSRYLTPFHFHFQPDIIEQK